MAIQGRRNRLKEELSYENDKKRSKINKKQAISQFVQSQNDQARLNQIENQK